MQPPGAADVGMDQGTVCCSGKLFGWSLVYWEQKMQMPTIVQRGRVAPSEHGRPRRRQDSRDRPCPPAEPDQRRERATPGPQDRALYTCRCGSTFQAPVTASVGCPHCGEPQAW